MKKLRAGLKGSSKPRSFELDTTLQSRLVDLAKQEHRSPRDLEADLIEAGLAQRSLQEQWVRRWQSLSAREQQVTALTCLGCTNAEISARLYISVHTVKAHLRNILVKFELHGKAELKKALEKWDFSEWEK